MKNIIRFHLAKGQNYKKWQITTIEKNKKIINYYPTNIQLQLNNCKLINKINKAQKIYKSGKKDVCGWIEFETFEIINECSTDNLEELFYNPIKNPRWIKNNQIVDNYQFDKLITNNNQVFIQINN